MNKIFDIFQQPKEEKEKKDEKQKKVNLFLLLVLIVLAALFFATISSTTILNFSKSQKETAVQETTTTPVEQPTSPATTATPAPEPTATTTPSETLPETLPSDFDKTSVSIKVLNGTTINGLAAKTKIALEKEGWKVALIGNAKNRYKTTVIYFKEGKELVAKAIENVLSDRQTSREQNNSVVGKYDIVVVLGLK